MENETRGQQLLKSGKELARALARHAVAFQSIATAEKGEDELTEAARETLHATTDALAFVLPVSEMFRLAETLEPSDLEGEGAPKDLKQRIGFVFCARLQDAAEQELMEWVKQRIADPKKKGGGWQVGGGL